MSLRAIRWAMEQSIGAGPKLVLIVLANSADTAGHGCTLSQGEIAEAASMDERTVRRHLTDLEEAQLIERQRRSRKDGSRTSDGYSLRLPDNLTGSLPDNSPGRTDLPDNLTARPDSEGGLPDKLPALVPTVLEVKDIPPVSPRGGALAQGRPGKRREGSRFCPADFEPSAEHYRLAEERHVNLRAELEVFRDYEFARPYSNWDRTFRNWLRRAKPSLNGNGRPAEPAYVIEP